MAKIDFKDRILQNPALANRYTLNPVDGQANTYDIIPAQGAVIQEGTPVRALELNQMQQNLIDLVYPVGSVYISVNNVNPSTYLGGTWAAFAQGRALVGVDTTQTEFNTVLKTGGAKTHNLQTSELPAHTHTIPDHQHNLRYLNAGGSGGVIWSLPTSEGQTAYSGANIQNGGGGGATSSVGSGSAHNNLPPYITVYMWRRTA